MLRWRCLWVIEDQGQDFALSFAPRRRVSNRSEAILRTNPVKTVEDARAAAQPML
jgi:hypothetical protein